MKNFKLYATAMALFLGLSMTSCLNSDNDDNSVVITSFVKVNGYMGMYSFKSPDGKTTIYPTSASTSNLETNGLKLSEVNIAFIQGTYDKTLNADAETSNTFTEVNVSYAACLDGTIEVVETAGAENDSVNHACIRSLDNSERTGNYFSSEYNKPWFFYDKTSLVLPISYGLSGSIMHKFTLVFEAYKAQQGDSELKLKLCHYNGKDTSNNYDSYSLAANLPFAYFYAFDLIELQTSWMQHTGNYELPEKIVIEYVASDYNNEIEQGETKTIEVTRQATLLQ